MVLKNCGPRGYPGMAEVGNMPLPPKVLRKGITDMVRISDARMSGTAYGTVVLHVSPEAAAGGTLALVKTGDMIELDVPGRRLHLDVSEAELAKRRAGWTPAPAPRAAGTSCIRITFNRHTWAQISMSSSAAAARTFRATRIERNAPPPPMKAHFWTGSVHWKRCCVREARHRQRRRARCRPVHRQRRRWDSCAPS